MQSECISNSPTWPFKGIDLRSNLPCLSGLAMAHYATLKLSQEATAQEIRQAREVVGDIPMVDCRSDWFEPIWWWFYMWWFHERFRFFFLLILGELGTIISNHRVVEGGVPTRISNLGIWCIGKTPNKHSLRGREGFAILNGTGYAYSI